MKLLGELGALGVGDARERDAAHETVAEERVEGDSARDVVGVLHVAAEVGARAGIDAVVRPATVAVEEVAPEARARDAVAVAAEVHERVARARAQ